MNAIACTGKCHATGVGEDVSNLYSGTGVTDDAVPDGHIGDLADWAHVGGTPGLILRGQHNRVTCLRKTAPGVFQDVAFEQHTLSILQFKVVFYDERSTISSTHEPRCSGHPLQRFEEMVAADLDVGGSARGRPPPKKNALRSCFQEAVHDFVRTAWINSAAALHRLRISAGARNRYAVEVVEVGVHDGYVGRIVQAYSSSRFVMRCAV